MAQFGWADCKFTFKALTFGQQRELDALRQKWQGSTDPKEVERAANDIVDIMKRQFVRGQALNDEGNKIDVKADDFEEIPFDIFLKLIAWVTSGEVDEAFLAS